MQRQLLMLVTVCMSLLTSWGQSGYMMAGPYEVVARDGRYANTKGGSERDMWTAWQCAQSGDHAKALEIVNAYARVLARQTALV